MPRPSAQFDYKPGELLLTGVEAAEASRLGNAVMPQVGQVVGRWALAALDQLDPPAGGTAPPLWPAVEGA